MDQFDSLSPESRVWIYQSSRPFTDAQLARLRPMVSQFAAQWVSHNQQLRAFGDVFHQRFIVLMVDESQAPASGCSIDTSVHFIKTVEQQFGTELFDRMRFAYQQDSKVQIANRNEFRRLYASGSIDDETLVFDNLVNNKQDFQHRWLVPLKDSWHKKMI